MALYILKRVWSLLVSFLVVSVVIFAMMHSVPGGPFDPTYMPLSDAAKHLILQKYGLDKPLYVQYLKYMWSFVRGDFGIPYQSPGETVTDLLARAWPPSLLLGGLGMVLGTPIGMLLGIAAAVRRNSIIDYIASLISTIGISVPIFVTSLILMLLFSVWLHWLPSNGWGGPVNWILPIASYSVVPIATFARYTRSTILDSLNKPFVVVLRSKGLSRWSVVMKHVLKNAAIPMITIFFPMFIGIATGTVFVEKMYRVPGLGNYFVSSIFARDYPMEMALALVLTLLVGAAYMITDILYTLLNPTIRLHAGRLR
ncbi:MAG TPA: ABC transporter permease [Spirochaetia bacterium]|nr:ABC transporter permease [Spirochaetia bacterium]